MNPGFSKPTPPPAKSGLANEARPGLGSRTKPAKREAKPLSAAPHDHEPLGRDKPLDSPAPREQAPNSRAHAQERDTGVSGHTGAT